MKVWCFTIFLMIFLSCVQERKDKNCQEASLFPLLSGIQPEDELFFIATLPVYDACVKELDDRIAE